MSKFLDDEVKLTYDDVLLVPRHTRIESRQEVTLNTILHEELLHLRYPVMSAAMDTVTEGGMALALDKAGGLGIIHRAQSVSKRIIQAYGSEKVGIAVGMAETDDEIKQISDACSVIALDVANAYSEAVIDRAARIDALTDGRCLLMVGNVVDSDAVEVLSGVGVDIIKVGIGGGAACTTRMVTGFGYPNFSAIMECAAEAFLCRRPVKIVADGGIRSSADIAKALAAGAHAVMLGSLLAGCDEAPGERDAAGHKMYRGMASEGAQHDWKGGLKDGTVAEGVTGTVPMVGPVADHLERLMGGLRSALTYGNARNIAEFRENVTCIRVTPNCVAENRSRV